MPSAPSRDAGWSLTRRMALAFALTSSAILLLYALWSTYFVFRLIGADMKAFMEDELGELALALEGTDGSAATIEATAKRFLRVGNDQVCAIRARKLDGTVVAEVGSRRLLRLVKERIDPDAKWREHLIEDQVATHAIAMKNPPMTLAIIVDLRSSLGQLQEYAIAAILSFLAAVGLAAVAGYTTAYRGLATLRDVTAQAKAIALPTHGERIRITGAPEEIRRVGVALNAMLDRIQTGLDDIRTFTAGLAHELRSPLMNLIGETEVTLLSKRSVGEYEDLLRSNLEDLRYLSETVDNLVAYCHTTQPEPNQLRAEEFDLAHEAELRLESMRRAAQRDEVEVVIERRGDTTLRADREGCLRVLRNLVGNAITWSPPKSRVAVLIEGLDAVVRIVVTDQGPGVPEDLGDRIFEPFVSGRTRSGKRSGYGLGLAICTSVMKAHGGRIAFRNLESGGAQFTAEFPREIPA
jgi:signal transduction histidine kinase